MNPNLKRWFRWSFRLPLHLIFMVFGCIVYCCISMLCKFYPVNTLYRSWVHGSRRSTRALYGGEGKERTEENRDKTGTSFTLSSPLRRGLGGCSVRMDFATVFMSYGTSPCPPSQGGDKTLCQQVYCSLKRTSNNPLQEQMDACVSMDIAQSEA